MKVLFLDIDGVLIIASSEWSDFLKSQVYDPDCVARLKTVIEKTGCEIVVSSSWRFRLKALENQMRRNGLPIYDITGEEAKGENQRGQEIAAWLKRHPEVTSFVIVDDDTDMGELHPHLVVTSWSNGLTEECMNELISKLGAI